MNADLVQVRLAVNVSCIPAFVITAVPTVSDKLLHPGSFDSLLEGTVTASPPDCPYWNIWIDSEYTTKFPNSTVKSNQRQAYDDARKRAGLIDYATQTDVLLVNEVGNIMETSISTLYVQKDGRWVTPTLASGCQASTTRRWALDMGYCTEEDVEASDVIDAVCMVSNGVKGFAPGRIRRQYAVADSRDVIG